MDANKDVEPAAKKQRVENDDEDTEAKPLLLESFRKKRPKLWANLPAKWKEDQDVAFAAWKSRSVEDVADVPCLLDGAFFRNALEQKLIKWYDLPQVFRSNQEFLDSLSLPLLGSHDAVDAVLRGRPELSDDRAFWLEFIRSNSLDFTLFRVLLQFRASARIKADPEIMLAACKRDHMTLTIANVPHSHEKDFFTELLSFSPRALEHMKKDAQRRHRDVVVESFAPLYTQLNDESSIVLLCEWIAEQIALEFWEDRRVVEAWIKAGLPYCNDEFPDEWKKDKRIFLLLATHCRHKRLRESFKHAHVTLRGDRAFMMSVVKQNPFLFNFATSFLQNKSKGLALLAFASSYEFAEDYMESYNDDSRHGLSSLTRGEIGKRLGARAQRKLRQHDIFVKTVLCGFLRDEECMLWKLNQGDTGKGPPLMQMIADYAGVPIGKQLRLFRSAYENYTEAVYHHG